MPGGTIAKGGTICQFIRYSFVTLSVQRGISTCQRSSNRSRSEESSGRSLNAGHGPLLEDGY